MDLENKLFKPLGFRNASQFGRAFGVGSGTLTDLKNDRAGKAVTEFCKIACACLEKLSELETKHLKTVKIKYPTRTSDPEALKFFRELSLRLAVKLPPGIQETVLAEISTLEPKEIKELLK